MPTTATLLQFGLASLLLAVTPGPSIVLLLAVGTERGRSAAASTAVGLAIGTATWVVVTAAGLGTLLAARPGALTAVTAVGAVYLLWLAVRALRDSRLEPGSSERAPQVDAGPRAGRAPLQDGAVVNLLNPNLALFLVALLPPFLGPDRGPVWQQVLVLGAVLTTISTLVNVGWGLAGAALGARLRTAIGDRRAAVAVATTYAGLGVFAVVTTLR